MASAGGEYFEIPTEIKTDSEGNCVIVGYHTSSQLTFGNITVTNDSINVNDLFIVKFAFPEVSEIVETPIEYNFFPNPTSSFFKIEVDTDECKVEIFDTNGKTVKEITNYNGEQISVSELPTGLYFVKIISGDDVVVEKLVVQ
jgi:hypothetical protein